MGWDSLFVFSLFDYTICKSLQYAITDEYPATYLEGIEKLSNNASLRPHTSDLNHLQIQSLLVWVCPIPYFLLPHQIRMHEATP